MGGHVEAPHDHQIVAVNHLVDALVAEALRDLARLGALDAAQLVSIEVHETPRELALIAVTDQRHHLTGGEVTFHLHDP